MLKIIVLIIAGVIAGIVGDELGRMYALPLYQKVGLAPLPEAGMADQPLDDSVMATLPYGMVIGETRFDDRPLFCIEQPVEEGSIYQQCRVSPGFSASFTKGVLHGVAWDTSGDSRLHKEWRKAGLNSNQTAEEFLKIINEQGAGNLRYETDSKSEKVLTFDVGPISYRLWLKARQGASDTAPVLYFHKLATILSF